MFLLLVLCVCGTHVLAKDSVLGRSCSGEVLMEQRASTKADAPEAFIVAFGGDPGDRISCIATRELSLGNHTTSSLIGGGPGKRYAILSVASSEDTDVDFVVRVFGERQLQSRVRRETGTTTTNSSHPMAIASSRLGQVIIQLRTLADSLESVQKIFLMFAQRLADLPEPARFLKSTFNFK